MTSTEKPQNTSTSPTQLNTTTEIPWWTTVNPDDVYYYDGTPRGTRPYLNVIPYKSFLRDKNFALITIPIFAAVTGLLVIVCILTRMNRCCFGLFETYPIRPSKRRCLLKRWLYQGFGLISPCLRKKECEVYCACHGARECVEQKFGFREDKTIEFLTEDEIRETFKVCKCDILPEPVQEIKRYYVASERNVRFNTEVTVVNPPTDGNFKVMSGTSVNAMHVTPNSAKSTFVKSSALHDHDNDDDDYDDDSENQTTSSPTTTGTESV